MSSRLIEQVLVQKLQYWLSARATPYERKNSAVEEGEHGGLAPCFGLRRAQPPKLGEVFGNTKIKNPYFDAKGYSRFSPGPNVENADPVLCRCLQAKLLMVFSMTYFLIK